MGKSGKHRMKPCPGCGKPIRSDRTACLECYKAARRLAGKSRLTHDELREVLGKSIAEYADQSTRTVARQRIQSVSGDTMVCSDLHVPFHDPQMVDRLVGVAKKHGITQLVVGGDLIGFETISKYRSASARAPGVLESLILAMDLLGVLASQFVKIYVIRGNHDDRLQKVIERAVKARTTDQRILADLKQDDFEALPFRQQLVGVLERWAAQYDLADVVVWSEEPMIRVAGPPGMDPWIVVHPAIYSRHAPQAEKRLWQRYTCSIIGSHGHIFGASVSPNGRHAVVQLGCMTDPSRHVYLMDRVTDHPAWVRGFGMIRGGRLRCYVDNPYYTDWEAET